jgi:hypothetical protein
MVTVMVTVEHVASAMNLSDKGWKQIEIRAGGDKESSAVRIRQLLGSHAEKIAVLELEAAFFGAQRLALRAEPLVPDEELMSLAYPGEHLRIAGGRFVQYGEDKGPPAWRCLKCMMGTTASCSTTAHRERLSSIAWAAS